MQRDIIVESDLSRWITNHTQARDDLENRLVLVSSPFAILRLVMKSVIVI